MFCPNLRFYSDIFQDGRKKMAPNFLDYIYIVTFLNNIKTYSELSGSNHFSNVFKEGFVAVIGRVCHTSIYSVSSSLRLPRLVVRKMYCAYRKGSVDRLL